MTVLGFYSSKAFILGRFELVKLPPLYARKIIYAN